MPESTAPGKSRRTWNDILRINCDDSYLNLSREDRESPTSNEAKERRRVPRHWLRWSVLGFLGCYTLTVLSNPSATRSVTAFDVGVAADTAAIYRSPEGLVMDLNTSSFPAGFMRIHFWAGVLLVPLCVLQKHTLPLMITDEKRPRRAFLLWWPAPSPAVVRKFHKVAGYVSLALIAFMAYGGFSLREYSSFEGFQRAMALFVAPWVVMFVVGLCSGINRWYLVHSIVGNAIFKACVAVPLARVLGSLLQRATLDGEPLVTSARGYYIGIASSAVVIGAWAIYDTVAQVRRWWSLG